MRPRTESWIEDSDILSFFPTFVWSIQSTPKFGIIRPPVTQLSAHNTDQVVVKVSNGKLLMFPAWLSHSVAPNESGAMRISISFNVMFSHFTENVSKPLWGDAR